MGPLRFFRALFRTKVAVHRDSAAVLCMEHCHKEAELLRARILETLAPYCDGATGRPTIAHVANLPMVSFGGGIFEPKKRMLLDAHCYAMALAASLGSCRAIDPPDQGSVMQWNINRLVVGEDVGPENIGRAPNPSPHSGMHISYAPGAFVHGTPSLQQRLVGRYLRLDSAGERLVMLLLSVHALRPDAGIHVAVYSETALGNGIVGRNRVGFRRPTPDQIDEWEDDLEITDADAALAGLPADTTRKLLCAIEAIDPFWPIFSQKHRLTW